MRKFAARVVGVVVVSGVIVMRRIPAWHVVIIVVIAAAHLKQRSSWSARTTRVVILNVIRRNIVMWRSPA